MAQNAYPPRTTRSLAVPAIAAVIAFLAGCAGPQVNPANQTDCDLPPASLAEDRGEVRPGGLQLNESLLDWNLRLREALDKCRADRKALREWRNDHASE